MTMVETKDPRDTQMANSIGYRMDVFPGIRLIACANNGLS